ncbi:unnamed protein product [Heligmosomoides polygyrus]|uniref:DUF4604 domain-containing protein n=1 Tax=Heligmosomoides polygyrus TaxID=6339 RepID=A0A183G8E2_HELPZ|nr:unnamed protein product [Heligmosomoides polygyrus]
MQVKNLEAPPVKVGYTAETSLPIASKKPKDLCKTAEDKEFEFETLKMEGRTEDAHRLTSKQTKIVDRTAEDRDFEAELLMEKTRTPGTSEPTAREKVKDYLKTAEDKELETKEKTESHVQYSSPPPVGEHERSLDKTADDDGVDVSLMKKNGHVRDTTSPLVARKRGGPAVEGNGDLEETSQKKNVLVPVPSKATPVTLFEKLLKTADDQEYDDYSKKVKAEMAHLPGAAFREARKQISVKPTEDEAAPMTDISKKEKTHSKQWKSPKLAEEGTQENGHDTQREDSSKSEKREVATKKPLQNQSESDKHLKESKTKGAAPVSDIPPVDDKQKSEDVQLKVDKNAGENAVKHKHEHEEADQSEKYAEGEEKEDEG